MTSIRIGVAADAPPGGRYFEKHGLLELHPPLSFPRRATLTRFRAAIPTSCEIAIAVTRRTHGGRDGALRFEREGARKWVDDTIDALAPRFVVLTSGAELSTGARDRGLLARFVEEVQAKGPTVVWQPRGLWDEDEAHAFAEELGCQVALDALGTNVGVDTAVLAGFAEASERARTLAYGRLEAIGTHARLGDGHLRRALELALASGAEDIRLVIESEDAFRKAGRLRAIVEGLTEDAGGFESPRRHAADDDDDEDLDEDLEDEDEDLEDEDLGDEDEDEDEDDEDDDE